MPRLPLGDLVDRFIFWLLDAVPWFFDGVSAVMTALVDGITAVLTAPPAVVWVVLLALLGFLARGWRLALYAAVAFALVESLDLWEETMQTLGLVVVAAALAALVGLPLGVWA